MFYTDLHIHSPYSQATSKYITLQGIEKTAKEKGITVIGTGDCLHPNWLKLLQESLMYDNKTGLYTLTYGSEIYFIPTVEVCCNFSRKKVHTLIVFPDLESAEKARKGLAKYGNLDKNGRPDLSLSLKDLNEKLKTHIPDSLFIIAHCLTPWFGLFGSTNHIDSLYEVFDKNNLPDALETGLSACPSMIRSIPELQSIPLVSFSDAHSLNSIGREVTGFDCELTYQNIKQNIQSGQVTTLEYPPQLGKYYLSGHRQCQIFSFPDSSIFCPKCKKKKTLGVLRRVNQLSNGKFSPDYHSLLDNSYFFSLPNTPYVTYIIPLKKIISACLVMKESSKRVSDVYGKIISYVPEIPFITNPDNKTNFIGNESLFLHITNFIYWICKGKIIIRPGYDGLFGEVVSPINFCNYIVSEIQKLYGKGLDCIRKDKKRFWCSECEEDSSNELCRLMKLGEKIDRVFSDRQ